MGENFRIPKFNEKYAFFVQKFGYYVLIFSVKTFLLAFKFLGRVGKAPLAPMDTPLVTHCNMGWGGIVMWLRRLKNLHDLNHYSLIYIRVVCHCMHTTCHNDTICRTTCHNDTICRTTCHNDTICRTTCHNDTICRTTCHNDTICRTTCHNDTICRTTCQGRQTRQNSGGVADLTKGGY